MCTRCWVQSRVCLRSGRSSRDSQPLFWSTCPWKAAEPKRARQPDSQTQRVSVGGARGVRKLAVTTTMTSKRKREEVVAAGVEVQYSLANALDEGVLACAIALVANNADDPTVGHTTDTQRIMGAVGRVLEPVQPFREQDGKHSSERKKKESRYFFFLFSHFFRRVPRRSAARRGRGRAAGEAVGAGVGAGVVDAGAGVGAGVVEAVGVEAVGVVDAGAGVDDAGTGVGAVRRRSRPTSTPTLSLSWASANIARLNKSTRWRRSSASRST
jgi:hypothetical protein